MSDDVSYRSIWTTLKEVPFTQAWVDVDGVSTRYVEAGPRDAPAVVMVHGTASSWETFCANIGPLSQHFRVVAYDVLGSGFTDKPDRPYEIFDYSDHLGGLMTALGIERASLVGVSLGAWISARFALAQPDRVEKMIWLSAAGLSQGEEADWALAQKIQQQRSDAAAAPTWDAITAVIRELVFDEKNVLPDIVAVRQAVYATPEMKQGMKNIFGFTASRELVAKNQLSVDEGRAITTPTLLVAAPDTKDAFLHITHRLAEILPNNTVVDIKESAHWPHFEQPDEFNELALNFLH
ncbi:Pimeloyl-ACP methyl ester carboxylesterase [Prauserella aidingensis]|nr:Pimeloyl-ACP methyl ester carboxylesterase [Prauserella aidingensis]